MHKTDVIVIGGGAAGLFCAIESGKRGRKTLVLEHAGQIGKKIAISGGGRCNFTNFNTTADNFISDNPHFCKSALARYTPSDFISLVEKHRIPYHEKKLGQLFCDESSRRIIDMLLLEAGNAGVEIKCGSQVRSVVKSEQDALAGRSPFEVKTDTATFVSQSLVIASGGLSIPPLGATDFGYSLARQFGLSIVNPRPALVPFTLSPQVLRELAPLSGVSIAVAVACQEKEFRENILITHRGLSGPAILQISSYWRPGLSVNINLLPDHDAFELLRDHENREISLANFLGQLLPRRFATAWCKLYSPSRPLKHYNAAQLADIAKKLNQWQVTPSGTEGFKKAEVTAGGVATSELSSQTMETKNVPGLYFIGEVVDVTGQLGGHNFQWAWASGFAAGQSV
ncbi:MAG TPA: aminoacetone oxidase family FAD-binding enzyme [Blastocatellia bacterium]|nr:aminoacetone oxidase family FAD-binding enzyme [Blastocatellia bacterium]